MKRHGPILLQLHLAAFDLVNRQRHYGKHEMFTMTHCGEGRGIGMRPPNQQAPLYAGVSERGFQLPDSTPALLLRMQQH